MAISFSDYGQIIGNYQTNGRARKAVSDMVMDATFTQDIQYQVGYLFDYYHTTPENRLKLEGFDPADDPYPIPVDLKFIAHSKKTYEKDEVTMHIQFRPGHQCAVDYYDDVFGKRYNAQYPVGLYIWLKGEDDIYRRWLIVGTADRYENQFPTWEVLRCDDIFRWICDGKYYEFPGVSRSQNSYNSGLWTDYRVTQPEDQTKFALPLNRDTEHLFYNIYLVIDANVLTEPRVWKVSKINRANVKGIAIFTCAQDVANQHTLKADYDDDGNVIAWWADWNESEVEPAQGVPDEEPEVVPVTVATISCSGKQQIKIGGSAKTLTVLFVDGAEHQPGEWTFSIDDEDASALVEATPVEEGKIKIKFLGNDNYIGKVLTATYTSSEAFAELNIEILPL